MNVFRRTWLALACLSLSACLTSKEGSTSRGQSSLIAEESFLDDLTQVRAQDLGQMDSNCKNSSHYDSCIFWKNPVAQNQRALASLASPESDLEGLQSFGARIVGLDESGFLQNTTVAIRPSTGARVRKNSEDNWKYTYSNCESGRCQEDTTHSIGQIMSYFWMTYQRVFMKERTGSFFALGKRIQVDTHQAGLANAYFSPDQRKIVLGNMHPYNPRAKFEFAVNAEILAHEYGHANFHFSHSVVVYPASATHSSRFSACRTERGCLAAINEGQADYHAAMLFADRPALGESITNSLEGMWERNLEEAKNLTASEIFRNSQGEIHMMGNLYASIWWELRSNPLSDAQEIDTLFHEHLMLIQGNDTFQTVAVKIRALDEALFSGKYSEQIVSEFARRGL